MELSVLYSASHPLRFKRSELIQNFSSLVWTERFSSNGDFQLVSNNISEILSLLPLPGPFDPPCMVAINDSEVPMIVESHLIEEPTKGPPTITTTGRSFETILEQRQALRLIDSTSARIPWTIEANKAADAALIAIDKVVITPEASPLDAMPEVVFGSTVPEVSPIPSPRPLFPVEPKDLYSWVIDTLKLGAGTNGLKATLPTLSGDKITVTIYAGTDRTETVVFEAEQDQFENSKHLLSVLGYKNVIVTEAATGLKPAATRDAPISGLARRVAYQNLTSEITIPSANAEWAPLLVNKGKVSLADATQTVLFSGEIAEQQAARYGVDYFLGDQVKLSGDYGLTQDVRIAEFVRSQDNTGIKSYPTFEAITPGATS